MKPFEVDDLNLHVKVLDIHGQQEHPLMVGTTREVRNGIYKKKIWCLERGKAPAEFAPHTASNASARISPSGKTIAFMSDREGETEQVFTADLGGKQIKKVSNFIHGTSTFSWGSNDAKIYAVASVGINPDAGSDTDGKTSDGEVAEVCWKLPYKSDGVGYLLGRSMQLFCIDVQTGACHQLTQMGFDVSAFSVSPDGRQIAYCRSRAGKFAHCFDLWTCTSSGDEHTQLTSELSSVMQPVWINGGASIVFAASVKDGDGELRLWRYEMETQRLECLDSDMEVALPHLIQCLDHSSEIFMARAHRGRHEIVRYDAADRDVTVVVAGNRQFGAFAIASHCLAFSEETPVRPSEIRVCDRLGKGEEAVSHFNPWWGERYPIQLESRFFMVPDGRGGTETVEGWLLRAKCREGPLPLLVDVHGGPASYALLDFDTNVFWHALCTRGWAVLMLNAVGSSSFGSEFCRRLSGHWGELDLPQYQAAIEQLQKEKVCDERISISGKSYGGYFTSWALGHTEIFKAAIVMAPVGNIETHYGTSDGGYYADPLYMGTAPAFARKKARELSPLQYIEKAVTPTLFLQGKDDERCPKCQSEELFVSLYNAGDTPAELVLYPGEGHGFLGEGKPACRVDAAQRIVDWLTKWALEPDILKIHKEGGSDEGFSGSRVPHTV